MTGQMSRALELKTIRDYCCSVCWGRLDTNQAGNVVCVAYGEEHAGFVTKYYANRRRAESQVEKREVTTMLQTVGVLPKPEKRDPKVILAELGF